LRKSRNSDFNRLVSGSYLLQGLSITTNRRGNSLLHHIAISADFIHSPIEGTGAVSGCATHQELDKHSSIGGGPHRGSKRIRFHYEAGIKCELCAFAGLHNVNRVQQTSMIDREIDAKQYGIRVRTRLPYCAFNCFGLSRVVSTLKRVSTWKVERCSDSALLFGVCSRSAH
jgi:hypothetical protein